MSEFFQRVIGLFSRLLGFIHDLVEPLFGENSWGWAIIGLTLIVRVLLLPLAIKQTRSMKAIQRLQPEMKAIQNKYKTDREMMRKDPEKYRARKQKQQQEMMALYQREGANPAASCLPLLAQAPVFIALFWTLRDEAELTGAPFYFFTEFFTGDTVGGLHEVVRFAGWPGWLLILLMSGTMFFSQKQMMARNAATMADNPMAQQQKILLYVMPVFLAAISFNFPLGILLYWVTTNLWQIVQQAIILREGQKIDDAADKREVADGGAPDPSGPARGATSGRRKQVERRVEPEPEQAPEETSDAEGSDAPDEAPDEGSDEGPTPDATINNSSNGVDGGGSTSRGRGGRLPRRGHVG